MQVTCSFRESYVAKKKKRQLCTEKEFRSENVDWVLFPSFFFRLPIKATGRVQAELSMRGNPALVCQLATVI